MRFLLVLLLSTWLFGAEKKENYQLQSSTYKGISKAQKFMDANKSQEAESTLLGMVNNESIKKDLDRAYIRFYTGYFYTLEEKYAKALSYFEQAVKSNVLPPKQQENAYLNIIQLSLEKEQFAKSLEYLDKLIIIADPLKAEYYVYKANIYMTLEKYKQVISAIDKAIEVEGKSKLAWIKIKFYAYYMIDDYQRAIVMLKQLIVLEPNETKYWIQLSSLYSVTDNFNNALASIDISRIAKLDLTENEVMRLVSWLHHAGVPYKAANILEQKLLNKIVKESEKRFNYLGSLYYESREYDKALIWYEKAAKLSNRGDIHYKIARIFLNKRDYNAVVKHINASLAKADEKELGEKYILLGKAYYELGKEHKARNVFQKALADKKVKQIALAWLNYLQ
ncbi:MAG: hypothetical protein U9Q40_02410 [Campylobacterota bacterium]|nr:hypothetical protein [Campylobacterota bacterium]